MEGRTGRCSALLLDSLAQLRAIVGLDASEPVADVNIAPAAIGRGEEAATPCEEAALSHKLPHRLVPFHEES